MNGKEREREVFSELGLLGPGLGRALGHLHTTQASVGWCQAEDVSSCSAVDVPRTIRRHTLPQGIWQGMARRGKARQGEARRGKVRQARQSKARGGTARHGKARQGELRQGLNIRQGLHKWQSKAKA